MKKIISLIICIALLFSVVPAVFAASSASAWATQVSAKRGDTVTVYVNLSTTETVSGLGVSVGYDSQVFDFAGASWTVANKVSLGEGKDFDSATNSGAILLSEPTKPNGDIFCISLRVKDSAPLDTSRVSFSVKVGSEGATVYASADISINCAHQWGSWKTITEATCTEIGLQERVCSICGSRQQSYIDAKGHDYSDWQTTKEATCTESGEQVRTCSVCGSSQARNVAPKGHSLGESATVIKEATCTEHGEAKGTCSVCGQEVTVSTPLAAHSYGEWYTIVQATCTEKGEREHECSVCGHVERQKSMPLGHDFSQGTLVTAATIYSTGLFEAKCSRCGIEGSIISPCSYTDEDTHIYLETEEDVFPVGTTVRVKTLGEVRPEEKEVKTGIEKYISQAVDYFKLLYGRISGKNKGGAEEPADYGISSISSAYNLYEIKAVNGDGDRAVQNGNTTITFPIPEGFGRNIAVYAIDDKGTKTDLSVDIDMTARTVKASASDLYIFALANLDSVPVKADFSVPGIVHCLLEGLLLLLLIIAWAVSGKRRKKIIELKKEAKEENKELGKKDTPDNKEKGDEKQTAASVSHQSSEIPSESEVREIPPQPRAYSSSLRDMINEELGYSVPKEDEVAEAVRTGEAEAPDNLEETSDMPVKEYRKPTLDDIFGEKK